MATSSTPQRAWFIQKLDGSGQAAISFDAIIRESHSSRLNVTSNPVETGVVVSDHAFMDPAQLTIEAAVGDFWLHAKDPSGNPVQDIFAGPKDENGNPVSGRSSFAWQYLVALQSTAEPFDIQTGLDLYENMVIENLEADQDKETGTFLGFRASLREIIIVSTQTVTFPPRAPGKPARQASKKVSAGEKQAPPVATPKQAAGVLYQMLPDFLKSDPDVQASVNLEAAGMAQAGIAAP